MTPEYLYVYRGTHGEAVRQREESLWEPSFRENVACARAIERALRVYFDSTGAIPPDCAGKVLEEYGFKRVGFALASTVQDLEQVPVCCLNDESREWAHSFGLTPDKDYGHYYCVDTADNLLEQFIQHTRDAYQALGLFSRTHCESGMYDADVKGKVLVMKPDTLKERCWSRENQLWLAEGGFGCAPKSSGRAIYATCLADGEKTRWNREDFIGVLDRQYLPDWAERKLEEILAQKHQSGVGPSPEAMTMC